MDIRSFFKDTSNNQPKNPVDKASNKESTRRRGRKPSNVISSGDDDDFVQKKAPNQKKPSIEKATSKRATTKKGKTSKDSSLETIEIKDPKKTKSKRNKKDSSSNLMDLEEAKPEKETAKTKSKKEEPVLDTFASQSQTPSKKTGNKNTLKEEAVKTEKQENPVKSAKNNFFKYKQATPSALGSKEIPTGERNCLLGLTFVMTGQLSSITREDTQDLIKRYGGKVTTSVSSRTSYVVIGEQPGESKLKKCKDLCIKTIEEDQLFELIRKSSKKSTPDQTPVTVSLKKKKSPEKEAQKIVSQKYNTQQSQSNGSSVVNNIQSLWVDKYKPSKITEICGNKSNVDKICNWLKTWSQKSPSVLISGPPGIGKTTAAHLCCKHERHEIIELNASDTRNKSSIDEIMSKVTENKSLGNFFTNTKNTSKNDSKKLAIIMDEVDGMSAGDRGGVAEIIKYIKKTKIPIICICNDRQSQKMRSLANHCLDIRFRRPDVNQLNPRIQSIARAEGLKLDVNVLDQLVKISHADIRQIIIMLSTWRANNSHMSYDQGKDLAKSFEKNIALSPFEVAKLFFSPAEYNSQTISDRIDNYFIDYSLTPLMIYENYIKCAPSSSSKNENAKQNLKYISSVAEAADSIAQGDIVNNIIGSTQAWNLLPIHALFSSIIPAHYMHGGMSGMYQFPSLLGNISKTNKFQRLLSETYANTRPYISSNISEFRREYIPYFIYKFKNLLEHKSENEIKPAVEVMQYYKFNKEAYESILDFGVGKMNLTVIQKNIETKTKTAFTKLIKKEVEAFAHSKVALKNAKSQTVKIDTEEIVPESDFEDSKEESDTDSSSDITKDSLVTSKKRKATKVKKESLKKPQIKAKRSKK